MLTELNTVRSYADMLKILRILNTNIHEAKAKLSKLIGTSTSAKVRGLTIGLDNTKNAPVVDKNVIPDKSVIKQMSQYASVINSIFENLNSIKIAKHMAEREFCTMKSQKDYLASCDKLIKEAEDTLADASKQIAAVAKGHVPPRLMTMFKTLNVYIDSRLPAEMYTNKTKNVNAFPLTKNGKVETLLITLMTRFSNLKLRPDASDKLNNFAYKTFCVVLTAKINLIDGKTTYHITASPEFEIPGTYDVGKAISETTVNGVFAQIISYYNFAMFNDRTPIPQTQELKSLTKLPNIKKLKIINDRITLLLNPNLSEAQKHDAMSAVFTMLKKSFNNIVNFTVNSERSIEIKEKVRDPNINMADIGMFTGEIKTPLLTEEVAKVALANDYDSFLAWYKIHVDEVNANKKESKVRLDKLRSVIKSKVAMFPHGKPDKSTPPKYAAMYEELQSLERKDKVGQFNPVAVKDVKVYYNRLIKYGLESKTIKEKPEYTGNQYIAVKEKHPVIHIEIHAKKISSADKKNWKIGMNKLNAFREEFNLSPREVMEFKKILFKS